MHGTLGVAEVGDDILHRMGLKLTQTEGVGGLLGFRGRFRAPRLDAAFT